MNTAKYIIKKSKLMNPRKKQEIQKMQIVQTSNKSKIGTTKDHLDDTYFLLSQMYSQENDPLFI
jgi:hypothetical protein